MIRFIHCADLHLGKSIRTVTRPPAHFLKSMSGAAYRSFEKIINIAIEKDVDFLLISGDVYDREQRPIKGQWFLKKQAERLQEKGIALYMIHGNHDPLVKDVEKSSLPENVHVFPQEVERVEYLSQGGERVYLYGFSYPDKAYSHNPAPLYERINDQDAFHIALLHGQEKGQTEHEPYAPFSLWELKEKNFDYWALGHIHKRQVLSEEPHIVYPGNIQGANRKEIGEKGAYLVEMTKGHTNLNFINTAKVQWEKPVIKIDGLHSTDELLDQLEEYISHLDKEKKFLLDLQIEGAGSLHDILHQTKIQEELLETIEDTISFENVHVDRLTVKTSPDYDREKLRKQDSIFGDMVRIGDAFKEDEETRQLVKAVFDHPFIGKYVNEIKEEDFQELIQEAEKNVLTSLLSEVKKDGNY